MRRALTTVVLVALLFVSRVARAQSWEVSGLVGGTTSGSLARQAPELTSLDVGGGFTWGLQGGRFFTPHWGAEVIWTRQGSALVLGTSAGSADLFTMTMRKLQGNVVYQFRRTDAGLHPFVFAGAGATFFSATDLQSETKLLIGLGGGVKYFPWKAIGVRGQFEYRPTHLNDESQVPFCDPFGFCQGWLQQVEFAGGVVLRF